MKLLFWLRKNAASKSGTPLYIRLTHNSERLEWSTKIYVEPSKWNQQKQFYKEASINDQIVGLKSRLITAYNALLLSQKKFTLHDIRSAIEPKIFTSPSFRELSNNFLQHKIKVEKLTDNTIKCITTRIKNFEAFTKSIDKQNIKVADLNRSVMLKFQDYCEKRKYCPQVINRNISQIIGIVKFNYERGVVETMPNLAIPKKKHKTTAFTFLDESQVIKVENWCVSSEYEQKVKDFFLFQCYTGLSYQDALNFDCRKHFLLYSSFEYIVINRQKTGAICNIPLLPKAKAIIEKYGQQLPRLTMQPYNRILKKMGKELHIDVKITSHIARKTAATFLLNNEVPIETVSRILGHSDIRVTQSIYATINLMSVKRDTLHLYN